MGKQEKRDDSVSGVMIYDSLGNERGGYVTDNSVGNAFLTLDSNIGQEVTLVAYPDGGAEFGNQRRSEGQGHSGGAQERSEISPRAGRCNGV